MCSIITRDKKRECLLKHKLIGSTEFIFATNTLYHELFMSSFYENISSHGPHVIVRGTHICRIFFIVDIFDVIGNISALRKYLSSNKDNSCH